MQWSLFLLILMCKCSFFTCHLYEYHFIQEKRTWHDAQTYCRKNYTDLATVTKMTDTERLCNSAENQNEAWIGLYNTPDAEAKWHWSLPGVEFNETERNENWENETQNGDGSTENCGFIRSDLRWGDTPCNENGLFICYDEGDPNNKSYLIRQYVKWQDAQNYCRKNHTDLVSGLNQLTDNKLIQQIESVPTWMFIGLFRDTWRWSDESSFSFRNWVPQLDNRSDSEECAVTMLSEEGRWKKKDCDEQKPFFCYDDKVILINESKTWVDALYYCRENHRDLVSITNLGEQRWVQERAKKANSPYVWLGLRYTCTLDFWFWVSDEVVSYKNWVSDGKTDDCDMSGAMDSGGQHKWFKKNDNEEFNFICSK